MNYDQFLKHLDKKKYEPCYLFAGSEDYLIDDCLNRLLDGVLEPSLREFNQDIFYGSQSEAGKIVDIANSYPMLADSRVVVVKEMEQLSPSGLELLLKYLQNPLQSTKLILIAEKADFRKKLFAQIKAKVFFVEFKPLYDNKIPSWIESYLQTKNLKIEYKASLLIQALVGNNLRAIVNELDKIILNLGKNKTINESDVQSVVGLSRNYSVFNLNDAIGNRQLDQSLRILNNMLESGESQTRILAMIYRHFQTLLKLKHGLQSKKSQQEITAMTGIPPFFISKTKQMAENFTLAQLRHIFEHLLDADLNLKTSRLPPAIALQTLLIQIFQ